jgi:hypothetical protein
VRRGIAAAILIALATIAGCGGASPSVPEAPTLPVVSASPPSSPGSQPPAPSAPVPEPSLSTGPDPAASPAGGTVTRDDTLLSILPPDLDGVPVTAEEDSFAEAAADPDFAANVARAAFAIVVAPDNLASGVVAELVPGVWSDTFFTDWRETYGDGACAQAGGVVGNAELALDGRTVHVTTCDGGLRVYHAYLEERGVLVSLFSLGEGRFGERLMADLRP